MGTIQETIAFGAATFQIFNATTDRLLSLSGPNGERLDIDVPIPGSSSAFSLRRLMEEASAISALLAETNVLSTLLIPDSYLVDLENQGGSLRSVINQLQSETEKYAASGVPRQLDPTNLLVIYPSGETFSISPLLVQLRSSLQVYLIKLQQIRTVLGSGQFGGVEISASISQALVEQKSIFAELNKLRRALKSTADSIQVMTSEARSAVDEIGAVRSAVENERTTAVSEGEKIGQAIAEISTSLELAKRLKAQVETYRASFDEFDAELAERQARFVEDQSKLNEIFETSKEMRNEAKRLLDRSRAVLGEATVAGLSDRFASEAESIKGRLRWAQGLFFAGTFLFVVSAGAALDVFPWLRDWGIVSVHIKEAPTSTEIWPNVVYLLSSMVGKILLLLPSLFIIAFSARWYAELFKMRGEYSYKYTIAASLPGFKIEAPEFADAVTAIAFQELLYNADRKGQGDNGQGAKGEELPVGNSWLQRLLEPVVKKSVDAAFARLEK